MRKLSLLLIAVILISTLSGCRANKKSEQIAATTLPVYEFTSFLCQGTDITVVRLVTENISCLHDYSLQVKQMRAIEQAELVVLSGAGLEDFLEDALHPDKKQLDASKGITLQCKTEDHGHEHDGHSHAQDPHIWLSPENARKMSHNIHEGLTKSYPQYTDIFSANLEKLDEKFDALIRYADTELSELSNREIITFHDGFSYMADAFNLSILHAVEEESGSEASASELIELANIVNEHDLHTIFTEKNGSSSAASVIASETGAKIYALDMALSGESYFTAMYDNIDTLKEALK